MKAKVKTTYQIIEEKFYETSIHLNFEAYVKENELEIETKEDLENALSDCLFESNESFISPDHVDISDDYTEDTNILNMEELVEYYSYLIIPSTKTCRDDAPYGSNFCPICGKKLNE